MPQNKNLCQTTEQRFPYEYNHDMNSNYPPNYNEHLITILSYLTSKVRNKYQLLCNAMLIAVSEVSDSQQA